jgi:hypothetical protein
MYFKMLKIQIKKSQVYILKFYVHPPNFYGEKTFFVACPKKRKKCHVNNNSVSPKFVFSTQATKYVFFLRYLVSEHKYLNIH